jgi:hypothetical protein
LQRSTVSAITERLIAERWVREGAIGHLPRGRKPTFPAFERGARGRHRRQSAAQPDDAGAG